MPRLGITGWSENIKFLCVFKVYVIAAWSSEHMRADFLWNEETQTFGKDQAVEESV